LTCFTLLNNEKIRFSRYSKSLTEHGKLKQTSRIIDSTFEQYTGVSEIRVLILTSERRRQFMKLFFVTFCKIHKNFPKIFAPQFLPNESFCVIN
jgi:hypothetical protein